MHAYAHSWDPSVGRPWSPPFDRFMAHMHPGRGGRGRGRRHGPSGGPWGFRGFGGPGGPRARRGDVRAAILALLAEEPRNGYGLMQEIERRSDGIWRPSPGSVYPALQQLEDEGLVRQVERDGGRAYELTDAGRAHVAERGGELEAPWDAVKEDVGSSSIALMKQLRQVAAAAGQLAHAGTEAQQAQAQEVLKDARRALYRILAEDEPEQDA